MLVHLRRVGHILGRRTLILHQREREGTEIILLDYTDVCITRGDIFHEPKWFMHFYVSDHFLVLTYCIQC